MAASHVLLLLFIHTYNYHYDQTKAELRANRTPAQIEKETKRKHGNKSHCMGHE